MSNTAQAGQPTCLSLTKTYTNVFALTFRFLGLHPRAWQTRVVGRPCYKCDESKATRNASGWDLAHLRGQSWLTRGSAIQWRPDRLADKGRCVEGKAGQVHRMGCSCYQGLGAGGTGRNRDETSEVSEGDLASSMAESVLYPRGPGMLWSR